MKHGKNSSADGMIAVGGTGQAKSKSFVHVPGERPLFFSLIELIEILWNPKG